MPSPDVTPYVDLTLNDMDPQDVFDAAIEFLQVVMPGWVPREGNTEVLLLEALAVEVAESVFALNRIPSAVVEVLLKLYGIFHDEGIPPVVNLRFYMSGTVGAVIPAGTAVQIDLDGGFDPIVFSTDVDLSIPVGQSQGVVSATGDRYTAEGNGVAEGTVGTLMDAISYCDYVALDSDVSGGVDEEEDDDYFVRGSQRFDRLSDSLMLPSHFTSFALEQPTVYRATTIDNYDPTADTGGDGPVGNDGGHVTLVVYGQGSNLTTQQKSDIAALIDPMMLSSLVLHIIDPSQVTQAVDVSVRALEGFDVGTVVSNVTTALQDYFDPDTWDWSTIIRRNQIISVISATEGVDFVESMTTPSSDVTLTQVAPLVSLGTLNVVVDLP